MNTQNHSGFRFHASLDAGQLQELFNGDLGEVAEVFRDFLLEMPGCFDSLEQACREHDLGGMKAAAHKCKTLFAYVGLSLFSARFQELELFAGAGAQEEALLHSRELLARREEVETLIGSELKRMEEIHGE